MNIGVISDTHGLLRPEVVDYLDGTDLIVHAGDIGKPEVIDQLRELAPVRAVRGNIDTAGWADKFAGTEAFEAENRYFYLLHNIDELDIEPAGEFDVVIFGHSHQPKKQVKHGVLYFNPGSAGPRRFSLPIAAGQIEIHGGSIFAEIKEFQV